MHVFGKLRPGELEESLGVVEVLNEIGVPASGLRYPGPLYDEGHLEGLVVHPSLIVPSMVTDIESLIGTVDDDRIAFEL